MSHKPELLPCPFCGCDSPGMMDSKEDFRHHFVGVICRECGASGPMSDGDCEETYEAYVDYAIRGWNRRATDQSGQKGEL